MDWKTMLAYISGSVDEELLLRNEYLVAENRILRNQTQGRLRLTDGERRTLAEIGKQLGKRALDDVASIVKPETILGWHRRLVAKKFDGSKNRQYPGRPRVDADIEELVVRLAKENKSWGYDRIAGALANLGHEVSDQTVGNILKRRRDLPLEAWEVQLSPPPYDGFWHTRTTTLRDKELLPTRQPPLTPTRQGHAFAGVCVTGVGLYLCSFFWSQYCCRRRSHGYCANFERVLEQMRAIRSMRSVAISEGNA